MDPLHNVAPPLTLHLATDPLFKNAAYDSFLSLDDRIELAYKRAKAIAKAYDLTVQDILSLRPKFWQLHMDEITVVDGAATTLLTIQYNLVAGTLAPFALKRPELQPLLTHIMNFDVSAQFLLSEVGHGLDSRNLETTATLLPDGQFDLHTPHPGAAKWMPPTAPKGSIPRCAIVIARLVVDGDNRGVRPFIVALGDGKKMCKNIISRTLPQRAGSRPVDHAITYFNHVRLPGAALLGSLDKPEDLRNNFLSVIWRVGIGSLVLSTVSIPLMKASLFVVGRYSTRRTVTGNGGNLVPIFSFRTQQLPILHTLAQVYVLDAYARDAAKRFVSPESDPQVRQGIAATLKAVMIRHIQGSLSVLSGRCGAQGVFEHNEMIRHELEMRGVAIAEGDVLALSIRLASELLLGRYKMYPPTDPTCLIARHEAGMFDECRGIMSRMDAGHRSEDFNRLILPLCQPLVEAIGHRMAYEAAVKAGVHPDLLALYEVGIIKQDPSWYVEHAGLNRQVLREMEDRALTAVLPILEKFLNETDAAPYCTAPIVSDSSWRRFVDKLPCYSGDAEYDLIPSMKDGSLASRPIVAHL